MIKKLLSDIQWKPFIVDQAFDWIENSKPYHKSELKEVNQWVAYVSRTNLNNGLEAIVKDDKKFEKNPANTIVFGAENADFFYQSFEYITWNKMYYIQSNKFDRYTWLFVKMMLSNSIKNCGFWYWKWLTWTRMKTRTILLPVDKDWQINRAFMQKYMKEIEENLISRATTYLKEKLKEANIEESRGGGDLNSKSWWEFFIEDVFDLIQRGKRLKKQDHIIWNIPYVSSTGNNNGIDWFIWNMSNVRIFNNCITLANSWSVWSAFYQPFKFVASDHITKLENAKFSKYTYMFLLNRLTQLRWKYGFNREINDKRIKREKLLLPITKWGTPDYEYMENTMKYIELKQIRLWLENTKQVLHSMGISIGIVIINDLF